MRELIIPPAYNPTTSLAAIAVIFSVSLLSFFTNCIVLYLAYRLKDRLYNLSYQITLALTLTDLSSSISVFFMFVFHMIFGYKYVFSSSFYCPVFGAIMGVASGISGVLIACLAFERYMLVCHGRQLPSIISWVIFSIFFLILISTSMISSIYNDFIPDPTYSYCLPMNSISADIENIVIRVAFIGSLLVLTYCYIAIFIRCYRWTIAKHSDDSKSHEEARMGKSVALQALLFLIVYYLCFIPKLLVYFFKLALGKEHPVVLDILAPAGIAFAFVLNPAMVIFLNRHFRKEIGIVNNTLVGRKKLENFDLL
ncbi:family A G protein-coupled receptor-like protein [Neoconidiobolus thromboides FSU 785]|nr:family A G protein-coupled receptor-like protein [Neoconidiobolus thromboides FSU 785]